MSIFLDFLVVFTLLMSVWVSYKKGFVKTIVSVLGYFLSFFLASFVAKWLSNWLFTNFLAKSINESIVKNINESLSIGDINNVIDKLSNLVPSWLSSTILNGQTVPETAKSMLHHNDIAGAANNITFQVVQPIVTIVISIALFFVIFLIIRLLLRQILRATGIVNRIPIIGTINGLLGAVFGVVRAGLYLMLIAVVAWVVILLTGNDLSYLNVGIINNTNLFLLFYKLNPLAVL